MYVLKEFGGESRWARRARKARLARLGAGLGPREIRGTGGKRATRHLVCVIGRIGKLTRGTKKPNKPDEPDRRDLRGSPQVLNPMRLDFEEGGSMSWRRASKRE